MNTHSLPLHFICTQNRVRFLVLQFPVHLVTGAVKTVGNQGLRRVRALYPIAAFISPLALFWFFFRCLEAMRVFLRNAPWIERRIYTLGSGLSVNVFLLQQNTQKACPVTHCSARPTGYARVAQLHCFCKKARSVTTYSRIILISPRKETLDVRIIADDAL